MRADPRLARQISESRLKDAASSQASGDRDVAVQILDRESALVPWLRSAIDRITDGSYGICLQSKEEIAPNRLKAMPWAALCIRCQENADHLASQRNAPQLLKPVMKLHKAPVLLSATALPQICALRFNGPPIRCEATAWTL
jgi:RNA polymerase-binding transcription factor DksA